MGSIQNRRGSVRQAPPDIYLPFLSSDDENDVGQECEEIATDNLLLLWVGIVILGVVSVWRGIRFYFAF